MSHRIIPLALGRLVLDSNIFYAPLAGCTDYPFRQIVQRYRPGLFFCEMVKMDAMVRNDQGTFRMLDYSADMHPIGAQLCGSRPAFAAESARIIEDMGFDVVDFNCGCPVDKVTRDGSGSAMLKQPAMIGDILAKMVSAVKIPVTVKVRAGWDDAHINAPEITRIAEEAGAAAITVHGRTRQMAYRGTANREHIRQCVEAARSIKVIGNGDIFDASAGLSMLSETGCDGILVARGTMGQPWIAEDIARLDRGEEVLERGVEEQREELIRHFERLREYYPDKKVVVDMRRIGCWYFHKSGKARPFRKAISQADSVFAIKDLITHFSFEKDDDGREQPE